MTRQANHIACVDDPYFRIAAKWNPGAGWTVAGNGTAVGTTTVASLAPVAMAHAIETGELYFYELDVSSYSSGAISMLCGGVAIVSVASAKGIYTGSFTAVNTNSLLIAGIGFTGVISRAVIMKYGDIHAGGFGR